MKKTLVVLVLLTVVATGCGSGGKPAAVNSGNPAPGTPTEPPQPETTTTVVSATLQVAGGYTYKISSSGPIERVHQLPANLGGSYATPDSDFLIAPFSVQNTSGQPAPVIGVQNAVVLAYSPSDCSQYLLKSEVVAGWCPEPTGNIVDSGGQSLSVFGQLGIGQQVRLNAVLSVRKQDGKTCVERHAG